MTLTMASTMKVNSISSRTVSRAVTGTSRRALVVRAAVAVPKEVCDHYEVLMDFKNVQCTCINAVLFHIICDSTCLACR